MAENLEFTLNTTLNEYLDHHFERTKEVAELIGMTLVEWKLVWTKNFYQERCSLLEKKLRML